MSQNVIAIAALVSSLVNLCMLMLHCRRDHNEFKRLKRPEAQR